MRNLSKAVMIAAIFVILSAVYPGLVTAEETVLVGLNVPLSGAYSPQGEDQLKAYKLAINMLNEKGGLLGKKVVFSVKDSETNADKARENAKALIGEGAIMLTGGSSSAEAIAQAEECQKAKVVFMAALTHSNDTTGKDAHRHTFRWYTNGHQSAKALVKVLPQKFGKAAKYAYIYADYTWGQTIQKSMQEILEKAGASTVFNKPTKLGEKSYVSVLLEAKKTEPNVLVLVHFGNDAVNALKQATQLKLREKMDIVIPLMENHMAHPLGPEIMQGIVATMPWYHSLSEKYEGSKAFVAAFEKEYAKKPCNSAATAWVNIQQYADAVTRAGSTDHVKVIKALEGHKFKLLFNVEEYWRDWDHQAVRPNLVVVGKTPAESKGEWDLFNIIAEVPGEELVRTKEENPVNLEPLE
ncbi:MAG: substrate-binding protein [Thermodesulfobacteriota bacterium]